MKKTINTFLILLLSCFFLCPMVGADENATKLLKKIDANYMPESFEEYRKIIDIEPNNTKREYTFFSIKKGKKVAMLYLSPASEKGKVLLRMGDDMWLYLPSVRKPIRVTTLQSATGGVFDNYDLLRIDYSVDYDVASLDEINKEARTVYFFKLKAKNNAVAYDMIKLWAYKDNLLLKKVECYSASNMLLKTLEFKEIKDFGDGIVRPAIIETYSSLYKGYHSYMITGKIKKRIFSDEAFTLNYLFKLDELR